VFPLGKNYLKENLQRLEKKFGKKGIHFEIKENNISVKEEKEFLMNNLPGIKQLLQKKIKMQFNKDLLWHINQEGIMILKTKKIKLEPSNNIESLGKDLVKYINLIQDNILKDELTQFFKNHKEFFTKPAARYMHHNYKGGLLEHTIQTVKMAVALIDKMDQDIIIDKDLLIAGALLHDIGKVNCYEFDEDNIKLTQINYEQNHIINGIKMISQHFKTEKLDDLIHILASHHNIKEWGSPVEPRTNEAWIIHTLENLSSKIMG